MNAIQPVLFDYNTLDTESRVKLQQLEREIKEDHHEVDRLVAETLDKMWRIGGKYHEVQILLGSRFKQWFTATHEADNGGLLRKAYRCINIHQNVSRDNLSLLAKTGKTTVYTLAARETPNAARAEIFKRLKAEEALTTNDIVEIIESAKAAEMPMMLPMVIDEPVITEIKQEFVHEELNGSGSPDDDHIAEANKMVAPAVTGAPHSSAPSSLRYCPNCQGVQSIVRWQITNRHQVLCAHCAKKNDAGNWLEGEIKEVTRYCFHCDHRQAIPNRLPDNAPKVACEECGKSERTYKWLIASRQVASRNPDISAGYHESMKPVGTPKFTPGQLNTTHVMGDKPAPPPAPKSPTVSDQEQYEAASKVLDDLHYEVATWVGNTEKLIYHVGDTLGEWQAIITSFKPVSGAKHEAVKGWLAEISTTIASFKWVDMPEGVSEDVEFAAQEMRLREFVQRLEEEISFVIKTHLPAIFPKQSAAPIAPPPPPAPKPVSELAKVEYDEDDEGDEVSEPVELKGAPIAPPPPPASAIPLPPPPPPLVARSQIDIAVEFSKLSEEKQFEVAWLVLNKLTKKQVSDLFIKYQTEGRK